MKVKELIGRLEKFDQNAEIMVLDSFNGGGLPREINLGPINHVVSEDEGADCADCEGIIGASVVLLGFGCY